MSNLDIERSEFWERKKETKSSNKLDIKKPDEDTEK